MWLYMFKIGYKTYKGKLLTKLTKYLYLCGMKKNRIHFIFSVLILFSLGLGACRKDDICTGNATPFLKIKFFAYNDTIEKSVDTLYVIALPIQDTIVNGQNDITDVSLALNVNDDESNFAFISGQNNDTLAFHYTREKVFVSKACGYKILFHQLNIDIQQDNNNWIKQIEILENDIVTDTLVHVKIYH